jgi:hypothetical protein
MNDASLGRALLGVRRGAGPEAAPGEAELLAHLVRHLREAGYQPCFDDVAGLLIALKLGVPLVCTASGHPPAMVGAVARVLAGGSELLDLRASQGSGPVMQRFDALRIGDFVMSALDVDDEQSRVSQGRPALLLLEAGAAIEAAVAFLDRQLRHALQAAKRPAPRNLFVVVLAPALACELPRPWHMLQFADSQPRETHPVAPLAVGYARRLVPARLTPVIYRTRVRELQLARRMAPDLLIRWCVAAFDSTGQGLLVPDDPIRNLRAAEALYWKLHVQSG